jgi:LPXTG-motif cell wall-anchored protein
MGKQIIVRIFCTLIILGVLILADFQPVSACSCVMPGPPNEAFGRADAVFRGEVQSISGGSGLLSGLLSLVGLGRGGPERQILMSVTDSWKGIDTTEIVVRTGFGGGDCGYPFRVGTSYLIYGYENNGRLLTNICSRTVAVSAAVAVDDFTYLAGKPAIALKPAAGSNGVVLGLLGIVGVLLIGVGSVWLARRRRAKVPG